MKLEKTNSRQSPYNDWHRNLGQECYAIDIDWIEYRTNKGIVAIICTTGKLKDNNHIINSKPMIWTRTELERKIIKEIATKLNVPGYYVIHSEDLTEFHVHNLREDLKNYIRMGQKEYTDFIKNLGKHSYLHQYC